MRRWWCDGLGAAPRRRRVRRRGLTLVEVLVACALLALLATAVSGLLMAGARLQAGAARTAARTHALEAYLVPGAAGVAELPACGTMAAAEAAVTVCLRARARCRLEASALRCDGSGPLLRLDLDVVGPSVADGAPLRVWGRAP